jgi:hypothetical protein
MNSSKKLTAFFLLLGLVAVCSLWGIRIFQESRMDPKSIGLEWMRREYDIDEVAFQKICRLHEQYFADRESMTSVMDAVERPILYPRGSEKKSSAVQKAAFKYEQELCEDYEAETIRHLEEVAALMKPEQGKRFLQDFTQNIHQQRIEHQRALRERAQHD